MAQILRLCCRLEIESLFSLEAVWSQSGELFSPTFSTFESTGALAPHENAGQREIRTQNRSP
jgi:hypothetical protein